MLYLSLYLFEPQGSLLTHPLRAKPNAPVPDLSLRTFFFRGPARSLSPNALNAEPDARARKDPSPAKETEHSVSYLSISKPTL